MNRREKIAKGLVMLICELALLASVFAQADSVESDPDTLQRLSRSAQTVVEDVSRVIVRIEVTGLTRPTDEKQSDMHMLTRSESVASGIILEPDGYIVTNAHVVEGASHIRVFLDRRARGVQSDSPPTKFSHAVFEARIVGISDEADLALVKIDATGLPVLDIADYDSLHAGQIVFAIGNPVGLNTSVSLGIVSAVGRESDADRTPVYIQTDAAINPGNSGGALVDVRGRLVGLTSFILTEGGGNEGLGFALPAGLVQLICRELKATGKFHPGEIGVRVQEISPTMASGLALPRDSGLIVSDVVPGSPAETAGVRIRDIVLSVDGTAVDTAAQFTTTFYAKHAGNSVRLELLKGSHFVSTIVSVGLQDSEQGSDDDNHTGEKAILRSLCVTARNLEQKSHLSGLRSKSGVAVVDKLMPCDREIDIAPGDVIRMLNNSNVDSIDAIRAMLHNFKPGEALVLQIERKTKFRYLTLEVD